MALEKKRKEVQLSTGDKVVVRALKSMDWAKQGSVPDSFALLGARMAKEGPQALKSLSDLDPESFNYVARCACAAIVTHLPQQRIVAKDPAACEPEEFSFFELEDQDSHDLIVAVYSFVMEGAEEAQKFS